MSRLKVDNIETRSGNNVAMDNALQIKGYTAAERDALSNPQAGDMIYNEDDGTIDFYNGTSWNATSSGTFTFDVSYLIIAGGGAGTDGPPSGGGGAGGYRNSYSSETSGRGSSTETPHATLRGANYTVSVGAGAPQGAQGSNSIFSTVTSLGGGIGRLSGTAGGSGGSGGGGGWNGYAGGAGETGQGYDGGAGSSNPARGGGGGGAGAAGTNGNPPHAGAGLSSSITGSAVTRAGGGGGGSDGTGGNGGSGGGGAGGSNGNSGGNGGSNTGGGGGGRAGNSDGSKNSGTGGSGIVILRWATSDATISIGSGLTNGGVQTDGSDSYVVFTGGSGNVSWS